MKKYKTSFTVNIGEDSYPVYLIVLETISHSVNVDGSHKEKLTTKYDLWCEHEIYAMAWHDIYVNSIDDYESDKLEEVQTIK